MTNARKIEFIGVKILLLGVLLQNIHCSRDFSPNASGLKSEEYEITYNEWAYYDTTFDAHIEGIYAYKSDDHNLYYADYDTYKFESIKGCQDQMIMDLFLSETHHLLITCSSHRLYFVDSNTNQKVGEIEVSEDCLPIFAEYPSIRKLFPCSWNDDYCIFVCGSVYLLNLNTLTHERIIWDKKTLLTTSLLSSVAISDDGQSLYLSLIYTAGIPIDEAYSWVYLTKIAKLDLMTGAFESLYDYPKEDMGVKTLYVSQDYLLVYDFRAITRFSTQSGEPIDSFAVSLPIYLRENMSNHLTIAYSLGDHLIVADANLSFYLLYPDKKEMEVYMALPYYGYYGIQYQRLKGGDVYACLSLGSDDKIKIINLSQKKIVCKRDRNEILQFVLKEEN